LVALIDGDHHEVTLASAGHIPPLVRRGDRRVECLAEGACGFPLWIDPEQTYMNLTVQVGPDEVLIFLSRGVTAVIDHQARRLDLEGLRLAIAQAPQGAASVSQSIFDAIHRFGQGRAQMDDFTLLCLERALPTSLPFES
jgi:serine phosphatase RsbU (regulator of sigma subunit)